MADINSPLIMTDLVPVRKRTFKEFLSGTKIETRPVIRSISMKDVSELYSELIPSLRETTKPRENNGN